MYYVYVLKSEKDDSLYFGYTSDLKRRFVEHNERQNLSTKSKTPFQLIYYESYRARADAKHRERQLKLFSGAMTHLKKRIRNNLVVSK